MKVDGQYIIDFKRYKLLLTNKNMNWFLNFQTWEETTKYSIGTFLQESLPKIIKGSHCVSAEKFYSLQDIINIGDNFLHIIDKVHENRLNI